MKEVKHGVSNMIPKAVYIIFNGNSQHPRDPTKLACWNNTWR